MAGMAPRIITPRRSALPAAVLPSARHWPCRRASRSVADPQLGDVDEPVARIRALDLRVHVQLAHLDGRLLEDVGQRELEPFGAALERGVGRAGLRARARLSVWMKSPGSPCTRNCAYSPRSAGPSGRAAQDRPRTARSEVSSVNLPWSSCSQARPLRRPATAAPAARQTRPAAPDRRPADRAVRSSWRGCPRRPRTGRD